MWARTRSWLKALLGRRRRLDDLSREMRFHVDMETERLIGAGVPPGEARRRALIAFGGVDRHREAAHRAAGTAGLEALTRDVVYGARKLRRAPGYAAAAAVTLALGIGPNAAIYSLVDAVLLRPLGPVPEPDRIARVYTSRGPDVLYANPSFPAFEDLRAGVTAFDGLAAWTTVNVAATTEAGARKFNATFITEDFFGVAGLAPARGRFPQAEEFGRGDAVAVLSDHAWRTAFGGDPEVLGREVRVNGVPATVVGVAPRGFTGLGLRDQAELWLPMATRERVASGYLALPELSTNRGIRWLDLAGRLAEGAAFEAAADQVAAIGRQAAATHPEAEGTGHTVAPAAVAAIGLGSRDSVVGFMRLVAGAVVLTLIIACANVAGLMLARGEERRREVEVRGALGATRVTLVRQLLTESVLLALVGGVLGLVAAWAMLRALAGFELPGGLWIGALDLSLDPRVLGFTFVVAAGTGILFGTTPAIRLTSTGGPRGGGTAWVRRGGTTAGLGRLGHGLVVAQVALTVVLLGASALLVQSLQNRLSLPLGFDPEPLVAVTIEAAAVGLEPGPEALTFLRRVASEAAALPGVEGVTLARAVPVDPGGTSAQARREDDPESDRAEEVSFNVVEPGYFELFSMRVEEGRTFDASDTQEGPAVALVNREFADRYWPGEPALGQRFFLDRMRTVVGVVANGKYRDLDPDPSPYAYLPLAQRIFATAMPMNLVLSAGNDPASLIGPVRRRLAQVEPDLPVYRARTVRDQVGELLLPLRMAASLVSLFGGLALGLAVVGVYGVTAYLVGSRTREIGIRMALGAERGALAAWVLRKALRLGAAGAILGLGVSLFATRAVDAFLFGVARLDPLAMVLPVAALLGAAGLAAWLPARRATTVDPVTALRME